MPTSRTYIGAWCLATCFMANALPNNPTTVLLAPNSSFAYAFDTTTDPNSHAQLLSLDLRKSIDTSNAPFNVLSTSLPFLQDDASKAFTPLIDSKGNMSVVTGKCTQGAETTQIWHFTPDTKSTTGDGTWIQYRASDQQLGVQQKTAGVNYLANGMAYSGNANGTNTRLFLFGGMCPWSNSTDDTWSARATYSNLMLNMKPQSQGAGSTDYDITLAASRGPPIAEAGFSVTALPPSYSANSASQQQVFVLLGGHTPQAFINMSQVALFSLPQESWTFLPVQQVQGAKTDLAVREAAAEIEPRSGHTAILSADGTKIIVYGGWVGDVNTPAHPQLAVLELGAGYGGVGQWQWRMPKESGNGPAANTGLFGHGAALLPGGIMMVYGGQNIAPPSSRFKRATPAANKNVLLFNTSSNTWLPSYNVPAEALQQSLNPTPSGLNSMSQKIGLGVGLSFGFLVLIGLIIFYIWYTRRLKHKRQQQGRGLLSRSSDGSFEPTGQPFLGHSGIDGRGGDVAALQHYERDGYNTSGEQHPWAQQQMQQNSAATGLFVNVPSPTRGLRKGVGARGYNYHAAPGYDDKRNSGVAGGIHPIAEQDDEDDTDARQPTEEEMALAETQHHLREVEEILKSNRKSDPFKDPPPDPLRSHPVSPEMGESVHRMSSVVRYHNPSAKRDSLPNWMIEPEAHEAMHVDAAGRVSPSKSDDRTSSTLSERSQRSTVSSGSIARTMSTRSGAILAAALAARSASHSPERRVVVEERTSTMSTTASRKSPSGHGRARSSTNGSSNGTVSMVMSPEADSFRTARGNFTNLQSEGEALLGGAPMLDRDDPYHRALAAHTGSQASRSNSVHHSPTSGPLSSTPRRQGLLGSLRRAIGAISTGERTVSLTGTRDYDADGGPRSTNSSPTKERRGGAGRSPRRAVSDGGALLRQKRGKQDWSQDRWPAYHDDPDPGDWGQPSRTSLERRQAEEEWDVENAVANRDVQVMFTVPKSRLRVVNADADRASLRSASDGAVSRTESLKALRHEESVKALRAKFEGDPKRLSSTIEEAEGMGERKDKSA